MMWIDTSRSIAFVTDALAFRDRSEMQLPRQTVRLVKLRRAALEKLNQTQQDASEFHI